jgi:hypothetical protein
MPSHRGGSGSHPDESMWDLWSTECQYSSTIALYAHVSSAGRTIDSWWPQFRDTVSPHRHEQLFHNETQRKYQYMIKKQRSVRLLQQAYNESTARHFVFISGRWNTVAGS